MHDETHPHQPVAHETFVLRIWREASSGAWRGEIVRVADRASAPFASFDQAEAFMRRYLQADEAVGGTPGC